MPTSAIDRRVLGALTNAGERLAAFQPADPTAAQLMDIARALVARAEASLRQAMDVEDAEELEAIAAADARRHTFDALGDAFSRLYDGLTAGVALARLRGDQSKSLQEVRLYLDETTPSGFRALGFQASLSVIAIARKWADQYVPATEAKALLREVDAAIAAADTANRKAEKESGEAVAAFRALEATRLEVRRDYIAARSALRSALQLTGTVDQIGRLMRSIDRVMRRRGPGPGDADDASDLPFEE